MSFLKHLEEKAEFLLNELKIRAIHHERDHGHVADDLKEIIQHLEAHVDSTIPAVVVNSASISTSNVEATVVPVSTETSPVVVNSGVADNAPVTTEVQQVAPVAAPLTCVAPK
jgi:CheY-specific phosphatase CheX